jgi:hypothetical protein
VVILVILGRTGYRASPVQTGVASDGGRNTCARIGANHGASERVRTREVNRGYERGMAAREADDALRETGRWARLSPWRPDHSPAPRLAN